MWQWIITWGLTIFLECFLAAFAWMIGFWMGIDYSEKIKHEPDSLDRLSYLDRR